MNQRHQVCLVHGHPLGNARHPCGFIVFHISPILHSPDSRIPVNINFFYFFRECDPLGER